MCFLKYRRLVLNAERKAKIRGRISRHRTSYMIRAFSE
jgi:hypothetical protein